MSRNYAKSKSRIQRRCAVSEVQEKDLYDKGKLLLEIYRDVCWNASKDAGMVKEDIMEYGEADLASDGMDRALTYLETFAPQKDKDRFEEQIRNLFETRWMIEIIEAAMVKVKDFPVYGKQYFDILAIYYLNKFIYTESEILIELGLERSSFYRRKKEAITVFGFAIWGSSNEELKRNIVGGENKESA